MVSRVRLDGAPDRGPFRMKQGVDDVISQVFDGYVHFSADDPPTSATRLA